MKVLLFLLFPICLIGQRFDGQIIDANTSTSIAYANIGVLSKGIGTVSNENGSFSLKLNDKVKDTDTIRISMIGYEVKDFKVAAFKTYLEDNTSITLSTSSYELNEITVIPKNYVTKIVGNEERRENFQVSFTDNKMGHEMGVLMKIKKRPTFIETISINIVECTFDSIFYRLNIYEFDKKTKQPTKNILPQPIYLDYTKADTEKTLTIDLTAWNIYVEDDFIVSIELVKDLGEGKINFSAKMGKYVCYYRKTSQAKWTKAPIRIGAGISVMIKQENK